MPIDSLPSIDVVEGIIGIPSSDWIGHCHEIACAILDSGLIEGRPAYGHYLGPVSPCCPIFESSGIRPHGWIVLSDGSVVDPTRWVWTSSVPDLWRGPADDYDEGGNRWRREHMPDAPIPSGRVIEVDLPEHAIVLLGLEPGDPVTLGHLFWLANLPPDEIDPAGPIYSALEAVGLIALVPLDNRMMISGR